MSFGRMPIANGFLTKDQFAKEYFFELKVGFCARCAMVQLAEHVDRTRMFHSQYAFFSSTSVRMAAHFRQFADFVISTYLPRADPFVIEIGSNDGIMLQHFAHKGIRHLGIEPSANVAEVAIEKGIRTISRFFDADVAREILDDSGQADAFLGANVMCHIPYLHSVLQGVRLLLKPEGVLVFEDPYLGDIVRKTSYDQIYDEHALYFSGTSVRHLTAQHGLELVDALPQDVHGGSMRYVIAHRGKRPVSPRVDDLFRIEENLGLAEPETFRKLRQDIEHSRDQLVNLLNVLHWKGKRVVGYAATSKSTTVTNYCGITRELVEFICDTTPIKQGKFSPGVHIPIKSREAFVEDYPDYALLFGWNHAEEIMAKEREFREQGGSWILYVPNVQVVQ